MLRLNYTPLVLSTLLFLFHIVCIGLAIKCFGPYPSRTTREFLAILICSCINACLILVAGATLPGIRPWADFNRAHSKNAVSLLLAFLAHHLTIHEAAYSVNGPARPHLRRHCRHLCAEPSLVCLLRFFLWSVVLVRVYFLQALAESVAFLSGEYGVVGVYGC